MKIFYWIFIFSISSLFSIDSYSQICKRDVIDCPGICGRFTDKDEDGICDFSPRSDTEKMAVDTVSKMKSEAKQDAASSLQKKAVAKDAVVAPIQDNKKRNVSENHPLGDKNDTPVLQESNLRKNDCVKKAAVDKIAGDDSYNSKPYPLLEICGLTLGFYFLTFLLVKFNALKKQTHRKIWNVILLATFLMSGLLGFFLVVQLNYRLAMDWYLPFLKLHVEFGIAMAIISVFHTWWHLSYYLNILRKKNK